MIVGGDCLPTPRKRAAWRQPAHLLRTAPATTIAKAELPAPAPDVEAKPAPVRAPRRSPEPRDAYAADDGDWRALVAAGHYAEGVPRRGARRLEPCLPTRERCRAAVAGGRRAPVRARRRAPSRRC